jgi:hypothetical protein
MIEALQRKDDAAALNTVHEEIKKLCAAFPIPDSFA